MNDILPGDFIVFCYSMRQIVMEKNHVGYNPSTDSWVEMGSNLTHLCVSNTDDEIAWINERGTFRYLKIDLKRTYRLVIKRNI